MKQILIFGEKPYSSKQLTDMIQHTWPSAKISFINIFSFVNPPVSYPRGLALRDYPYISHPVLAKHITLSIKKELGVNEWADLHLDSLDFDSFDEIVYAGEPDHTGVIAFYQIIEKYMGSDVWRERQITSVRLNTLDAASITKSFSEKDLFIEMFSDEISYGRVKRYFDWNWNLNSIAILGLTLTYAGCKNHIGLHLSKYSLQLFHYLLELEKPKTHRQLLVAMSKWKGTGKYPTSDKFGSAASRWSLIILLSDLGLIETADDDKVYFTETGRMLAMLLHKDTKDYDLPTRIDKWCTNGLESSKDGIDTYIKTFFGKQLKLIDKPGAKKVFELITD